MSKKKLSLTVRIIRAFQKLFGIHPLHKRMAMGDYLAGKKVEPRKRFKRIAGHVKSHCPQCGYFGLRLNFHISRKHKNKFLPSVAVVKRMVNPKDVIAYDHIQCPTILPNGLRCKYWGMPKGMKLHQVRAHVKRWSRKGYLPLSELVDAK